MSDLFGLGKFWEKLIDVSAKWLWGLYNDYKEPKRLEQKWTIEAENKKKMIIAEAEGYSEALKIKVRTDLEMRALSRLSFQESKKQQNIENILEWASKMDDWEVSDEKVDDDWITRFFNIAWDISLEKIQIIWSKILAWEIKKPWTHSLRTLEVIRNISSLEAEIFNKIAWIVYDNESILKLWNNYIKIEKITGVSYKDFLLLEEAWLMSTSQTLSVTYFNDNNSSLLIVINFKNKFIGCKVSKSNIKFPVFKLTKAWKELLSVVSPNVNENYFEELCNYLKSQWCTYEINNL